jgi:DNA-binding beta-propeller fold protein YncE
MKNNKIMAGVIIGILVIGLGAFAYMYFFMIPRSGSGGVVSAISKKVGNIDFLFGVYGPGKGDRPRFYKPMAVATDQEENIYVTDSGNNRVVVFNKKGEFLFEFGGNGVAHPIAGVKATWKPGTFDYPYGIDIDRETSNIFVADMANKRIQIFDRRGKFIDWFPKGKFGGTSDDIFPTDIAVKKGKVYIANPYQVVIFDTKGKFIKDFGMPGREPGNLDRPNGIDVGEDGTIYVADSNNLRIQAFAPDGKVKWVLGKKFGMNDDMKKTPGREFGLPRNISVGPDGNIYIADAFHFSIKVLSPEGKKLAAMGRRGTSDGYLNFPNGIVVTDSKKIYVVEKENHRLQALSFNGFVIDEEE